MTGEVPTAEGEESTSPSIRKVMPVVSPIQLQWELVATMHLPFFYASRITAASLFLTRTRSWASIGKLNGVGLGKYVSKTSFFWDSFFLCSSHCEGCLFALLKKEFEHTTANEYDQQLIRGSLDISVRRNIVDWIMKVHDCYNFGPLSAYLSINYQDHFLSAYELSNRKAWMTQLLAVACLSLAAKMKETEVPLSLDLQDKVMKCYEVIQDMRLVEMRSSLVSKAPQTPVGVLDVTCLSYTSAKTTACSGSNSQSCAAVKSRRLNNPSV